MNFPQSVEEQIKELTGLLKLKKSQVEKLRKMAEKQYSASCVDPGESVGVVSAQSIGEPGTQLAMRTKWLSGATEMNVTQGLPRLIEIFDARSKPTTPNMTIYIKQSYSKSEANVENIALRMQELNLEDVSSDVGVDIEKMRVEVNLDSEKLKRFGLTEKKVLSRISESFKTSKITTGSLKINIKPKGEEVDVKTLYKFRLKISGTQVGGIKEITQVLPIKYGDNWIIKTMGSNLKEVILLSEVDIEKTTTNDIFEIWKVLGIEAARNAIIDETLNVLKNQGIEVDVRHVMLLADVMTHKGKVKGIGRYGVSGAKTSVLARASFEVPLKHLFNAAVRGEIDELTSVVENVMINQPVPVGTGIVELRVKKGDEK